MLISLEWRKLVAIVLKQKPLWHMWSSVRACRLIISLWHRKPGSESQSSLFHQLNYWRVRLSVWGPDCGFSTVEVEQHIYSYNCESTQKTNADSVSFHTICRKSLLLLLYTSEDSCSRKWKNCLFLDFPKFESQCYWCPLCALISTKC